MAQTPAITITGASGRMGQMLLQTVMNSDKATLVGAVERKGHPWVGRDVGEAMGGQAVGVVVTDEPLEAFALSQAVIDFTAPAATLEFAALAAQARAVHVIGTTGMSEDDLEKLEPASRHAVIVRAGNMSLGVNLLTKLTEKVAAALDEDFDIEIIEAHHRHKVDAPSGTALAMGEAIAGALNKDLKECAVYSREGHTGERVPGTIGFATVRAGDIVGEHTAMFADIGERIEITHKASSRMTFANGAVRSALWLKDKKNGLFDMRDVLDLNSL